MTKKLKPVVMWAVYDTWPNGTIHAVGRTRTRALWLRDRCGNKKDFRVIKVKVTPA